MSKTRNLKPCIDGLNHCFCNPDANRCCQCRQYLYQLEQAPVFDTDDDGSFENLPLVQDTPDILPFSWRPLGE